jgi:hypothetical protein
MLEYTGEFISGLFRIYKAYKYIFLATITEYMLHKGHIQLTL